MRVAAPRSTSTGPAVAAKGSLSGSAATASAALRFYDEVHFQIAHERVVLCVSTPGFRLGWTTNAAPLVVCTPPRWERAVQLLRLGGAGWCSSLVAVRALGGMAELKLLKIDSEQH